MKKKIQWVLVIVSDITKLGETLGTPRWCTVLGILYTCIIYIQVFILGYFIFHIGSIDISIEMSYIWMWKHQKHSTVFQEWLLITEDLGKRRKNQLSSWNMHCRCIFQLSLLLYDLLPWHHLEILIWLRKRWNTSSSGITALRQTE